MALETRRRELAVLGAPGASRRSVVLRTMAELGLLGGLGGLLGTLGGLAVAAPIVAGFSRFTEDLVGAQLSPHVPGSAVVIGLVPGAGLGEGGAGAPSLRSGERRVGEE